MLKHHLEVLRRIGWLQEGWHVEEVGGVGECSFRPETIASAMAVVKMLPSESLEKLIIFHKPDEIVFLWYGDSKKLEIMFSNENTDVRLQFEDKVYDPYSYGNTETYLFSDARSDGFVNCLDALVSLICEG